LAKPTSDKEINALMKKYANGALKDVLAYTEDQIVSSDIIGAVEGSIFDATQTKVFATPEGKQLVKVVAWYDNEYSYTCQYIRLAKAYADVLGI
jgi:glyceraldehyde 3-phosphate dehydrogenase